jgi:hypothetical protein
MRDRAMGSTFQSILDPGQRERDSEKIGSSERNRSPNGLGGSEGFESTHYSRSRIAGQKHLDKKLPRVNQKAMKQKHSQSYEASAVNQKKVLQARIGSW